MIVYKKSSKKLATSQENFLLIEYIAAAEDLCSSLEESGDDESVEKAKKIRNFMICQLIWVKECEKDNLSADDFKGNT